jgi:hypothetical protein
MIDTGMLVFMIIHLMHTFLSVKVAFMTGSLFIGKYSLLAKIA